ncbi:MAG TPA: hypothetical protein EYP57_08165 [Thermodesulfobacteriaceae bacterium]|nr:hypothetical protein [Thermodesulfobacteriaceae bacterium]
MFLFSKNCDKRGMTLLETTGVILFAGVFGIAAVGKYQIIQDNVYQQQAMQIAEMLSDESRSNLVLAMDPEFSEAAVKISGRNFQICRADILGRLLPDGAIPPDFEIGQGAGASEGLGSTVICMVTHTPSKQTSIAKIYCTGSRYQQTGIVRFNNQTKADRNKLPQVAWNITTHEPLHKDAANSTKNCSALEGAGGSLF